MGLRQRVERRDRAFKEGKAYIFFGRRTLLGLSVAPDWSFASGQVAARLGASVSGAGDVNGDGVDDVIVGLPNYWFDEFNLNAGAAYIFLSQGSDGPALQPAWTQTGAGGGLSSARSWRPPAT